MVGLPMKFDPNEPIAVQLVSLAGMIKVVCQARVVLAFQAIGQRIQDGAEALPASVTKEVARASEITDADVVAFVSICVLQAGLDALTERCFDLRNKGLEP